MAQHSPTVYAIDGVPPEVLAYSMAKYSRSALSMQKSIAEISSQRASNFLDTFYFQYGHKSIADMAHLPMAMEDISMIAAIEVVDENLWDGQERSTRYQDFSKRLVYTPEGLNDAQQVLYRRAITDLFDGYDALLDQVIERFHGEYPKPLEMDPGTYERTIKARAFDVARYLLPLATLTSVGQVTSARTLESQLSRMKASPFMEVRKLAGQMQEAVTTEQPIVAPGRFSTGPQAPTLIKHAEADEYTGRIREYMLGVAHRWLGQDAMIEDKYQGKPECTLYTTNDFGGREREIVASLIYEQVNCSMATVLRAVGAVSSSQIQSVLAEVMARRGPYDALPRAFRTGGGFNFDIFMDIGGFRDLHRHRRCTQIIQPYFQSQPMIPEGLTAAELGTYLATTDQSTAFRSILATSPASTRSSNYLLPLGSGKRMLMKMDLAEVIYIAELRTKPAGHISYRRVAWSMYQALKLVSPTIAGGIEESVCDPNDKLDFFKR